MKTLRQALADAEANGVALGHFNVADSTMFRAVADAARSVGQPVIVGVSEDERDFIGIPQIRALVESVRADGQAMYLNADHTYSLARVKEAIDAGFDSVIWDGSEKSYEENRDTAKQAVEHARLSGKEILVEAELGFIGKGSSIKDAPPEGAVTMEEMMTTPEEAKRFVEETGVDVFAPAVGNLHGVLRGGKNPHISAERVKQIREAAGVPLVLHGGSGISDGDFKAGIAAGLAQIHVSTEMRIAYRKGIETAFSEKPDQLAPYRYLDGAKEAVQKVVEEKIKLFNNL